MEALAVVSLAGNILQFVEFASKVFVNAKRIYEYKIDAGEEDEADAWFFLTKTTADLQAISSSLTESKDAVQGQVLVTRPAKDPFVELARGCEGAAADLLALLDKMKATNPRSIRSTFMAATRAAWKEREMKELQGRVDTYRSQLMIHLQVMQSTEWKYIADLVKDVSKQNKTSNTELASEVAKLTREVKVAIDHWSTIRRERSLMPSVKDRTKKGWSSHLDADEEVDNSSHVADLIWKDYSSSPKIIMLTLLNTLTFPSMEYRHADIRDAHPETFEWAFENLFSDWLESRDPIFWISGKPGSGKSTLMKFLVDSSKTSTVLRKWSGTKKLVTSSYFFWIGGTTLQRSREGLLRALLFEILHQCPDAIEEVLPDEYSSMKFAIANRKTLDLEWPRSALLNAFARLSRCEQARSIAFTIFIDGLDEYSTDAGTTLEDLVDTVQHLSQLNVKLCVASRPWNEFEYAYGQDRKHKIYLQELNKPDIELYVADNLGSRLDFQALGSNNALEAAKVLEEVVDKAQGVFLWVHLVVRSLIAGLKNHDRISQLRSRLERFPNDLDGYFRHIFETLEPDYRMESAHTFQVALAASVPLSPIAYWFMDEEEESSTQGRVALDWPEQNFSKSDLKTILTKTNARLNARCKGLLEITPPFRSVNYDYRVDFLHRTVRDFFLTNSIYDIFTTNQRDNFRAHSVICHGLLGEIKSITTLGEDEAAEGTSLIKPVRALLHSATCLEKESNESPIECLHQLKIIVARHSNADRSRGRTYIWSEYGRWSFMGVIVALDLHIFAKEGITRVDEYEKETLLKSSLRTEPFTLEMFLAIMSSGPKTSFDGALQDALADKLDDVGDLAVEWVNIVLTYSSFTCDSSTASGPLASKELWTMLSNRLPVLELRKLSRPMYVPQRTSRAPKRSWNPLRCFRH